MFDAHGKMIAALVAALIAGTGCRALWPFGRRPVFDEMSSLEAKQMLNAARDLLYTNRPEDRDEAIRLADSVVRDCSDAQMKWSGLLVKAAAHQRAGNHKEAAEAAEAGVTMILAKPGPIGDSSLRAVKLFLRRYVESAVSVEPQETVLDQLSAWRGELGARLSSSSGGADSVRSVDKELAMLREMAAAYYSAGKPEVAVRQLLQQFVVLFNTRNKGDIEKLLVPGSRPAMAVAEKGVTALVSRPAESLRLASGVRLDAQPAASGGAVTATCEMVTVSPAGWAELIPMVRFDLVPGPSGTWLIKDISNL